MPPSRSFSKGHYLFYSFCVYKTILHIFGTLEIFFQPIILHFCNFLLRAVGKMEVDVDKNRAAYGDVSPATILHGDMDPPHEFQPLYGELSRIVNRVERPSANPARVSASLERYSAGHDPDRVMVLPDGAVIRQDLAGPPNE